jgi:Fe-S cluster assembly iron-binding protein IscA
MMVLMLQRLRKSRVSGGCSGLSYDLKFDKNKSEDDKIFIDNDITIVEKKSFFI